MADNLPPGCSSPDGGIDHAMESALENLCDAVDSVELANALKDMVPAVRKALGVSYELGFQDQSMIPKD